MRECVEKVDVLGWNKSPPITNSMRRMFSQQIVLVVKLSTFRALCFHFPTGAADVFPYIGFETSKIFIGICKS